MKSGASEARRPRSPGAWLYAAACAGATLALLPVFREGLNPDAISYLTTAREYLAGHFRDAVNAYWGPLYSLLIVPFLAGGLAPLLAARVLGIVLAGVAALAAWRLATVMGLRGLTRAAVLAALIPLLVLTAHQSLSPDLLLSAILLFYLGLLADPASLDRPGTAFAVGTLGGLAYWSKAYGFYFVLAHIALVALGDVVAARGLQRRRVLAFYGRALAVFALLAALWMGALDWKYGRPMVSSTGAYNRVLAASGSRGHPMLYRGFLPPPDAASVSAWDDPTSFDLRQMQAAATPSTSSGRLGALAANLRRTVHFLRYFVAVPCLVIFAWLVSRGWRRQRAGSWRPLLVVGAAALIYPAGYIPVLVTVRYLLFLPILLAVIAAALAPGLGPRRWGPALAVAIAAGVAVVPARELGIAAQPVQGAASREIAAALAPVIARGRNLASDGEWEQSLFLAHRLGDRYFGQRGDLPPAAVPAELARLGVDYYLVWHEAPADAAPLQGYREVGGGRVAGLKVYALGERAVVGP